MDRRAALLAGLLLVPAPAAAHVKPKIPEAPAGARFTFSFVVDHGCEGSPTTGLSIQLPEGAFDARPVAKTGWTAQVVEGAVHFDGGPLPDKTEDSFSVELVTPNRSGEDVLFPTVQRCQVGVTHWIAPQAEAENPAPRVRLTPNPSPITAPPPMTTTVPAPATSPTTIESAARRSDDGGGSGLLAVVVLLGAVAIGAGWLLYRRRGE